MRNSILYCLGICCVTITAVSAEDEPVRLPEVVVTATRSDTDLLDLPYTSHVLTDVELRLEQMVRTVPEALNETPGVMVQKTAHGQGSPYIRGFTGFRTLMLVDGIRLNNSTFREGPNQYWSTVDPLSLDRLELVKGPSSVLYGSDAIGGTVNAITRSRDEFGDGFLWDRRVYYRYASAEDSHMGRGEVTGSVDQKLGFVVGASVKSFGDLETGDASDRQPTTGYDEWDGDAKMEYRFTETSRLVVAYQHVDQDDIWRTHRTVYAVPFEGTTVGTDLRHIFDQNRDLAYAQYHVEPLSDAIESIKLSVSYHRQAEDLSRIKSDLKGETQTVDVDTAGWGIQFTSSSPVGRLTYGAEYYRDWVNSTRDNFNADGSFAGSAVQGPVADDANYDLVGVYLQDEIPVGSSVDLILGVRYNYARADADKVLDPETGNTISITDDWNNVVGSGRVLWRVDEARRWTLFAGASQGFRAPNLSDLTRLDIARSGELETPAPGLDPEEYVSLEGGARLQLETFTAEVSYYYTFIDGMIVRAPTGNVVNGALEVTKRNAGDGFIQGIEAMARWQWHPQWSLFGWISWMEGAADQYPTSSPVPVEEDISRLMPLTGQLGLRWDHPKRKLWAEIVGLMADRQDKLNTADTLDTQRIPPGGTPGYGVIAIRGGWRVRENITVTGGIENLTDKEYRVHGSGLNEPGRNAIVAVEIKL